MIIFKQISWSNFLSTGNVPNTIDLTKSKTTLIAGMNGAGKSTLLDAITFVLYGKAFRNITKNQLINSINQKNCLVSVEFTAGGKEYKVTRGIKPNIFNIDCDSKSIIQDAALKDYQAVLEQQILKINFKTFTQVVILGSATYTPFMQLQSSSRREVIEELLDIRIFSNMNNILKERMSLTKEHIADVESRVNMFKLKIENQKSIISTLTSSKNDQIEGLQERINHNLADIKTASDKVESLQEVLTELRSKLVKKDEILSNIEILKTKKQQVYSKKDQCSTHKEFFTSNDTCPSCAQSLVEEYKAGIINELHEKEESYNTKLNELSVIESKLADQLKDIIAISDKVNDVNIDISTNNTAITILNKQNSQLQSQINEVSSESGDVAAEKAVLKSLAKEAMLAVSEKAELLYEKEIQAVSTQLLKDTGIKTAIIKEYLPLMNKLINKYLSIMDFYCKFELDEAFNESIKSRHRDDFTYASFSEGEKQKLDIAIMLTWRQIARMKNSAAVNLLLMDETLDQSLDQVGTDIFLNIINSFEDGTNTIIISHKGDVLLDKFERTIKVQKKQDFSILLD